MSLDRHCTLMAAVSEMTTDAPSSLSQAATSSGLRTIATARSFSTCRGLQKNFSRTESQAIACDKSKRLGQTRPAGLVRVIQNPTRRGT